MTATSLINLTPHAVVLHAEAGVATLPSQGVARVAMERRLVAVLDTEHGPVQVYQATPGPVEGLPEPDPACRVRYIVSRVVAEAARERHDLLIPDDTVRDEQGRIIGCRALARL